MRVSLSVSPFTEMVLAAGCTFIDGAVTAATVEDVQRLFVSHGSNEVYARIATTRQYRTGFGDHSMERGLERARMAAALQMPFNPELGLFNIYGDMRCQPAPDFSDYPEIQLPGPWPSLTLDQMTAALRAYGAAAAREILATGVEVRIWDIGNEIEFGIAGVAVRPLPGSDGAAAFEPPDAVDPIIGTVSFQSLMRLPENQRAAWLAEYIWPHEARLLSAVADGIRSLDPKARFSTHVSGMALPFFKAMKEGGFVADELGVSYYPTASPWPSDRLQAFKDMATAAQRELGRPVFIAEFGYPAGIMEGTFPWNSAVPGYPQMPDGQAAFLRDLIAWGAREKILSGIRPWAPDLALSTWAPMSLFTEEDRLLTPRPALDALRP